MAREWNSTSSTTGLLRRVLGSEPATPLSCRKWAFCSLPAAASRKKRTKKWEKWKNMDERKMKEQIITENMPISENCGKRRWYRDSLLETVRETTTIWYQGVPK